MNKHPRFLIRESSPFNGEPPPDLLIQSALTPTELFFSRNHGDIPQVDPADYRLAVRGLVEQPLNLSLAELIGRYPKHTFNAALQCAGNRRLEMSAAAPIPGELPWDSGAISAAEWSGVSLSDILREAGLKPAAQHVELTGLDRVSRQGQTFGFGGSIPLSKALAPETILAYEMNGQPLSALHGYPLRAFVPGYIGARSVKWLGQIEINATASENYFYARAYQLFPPQASAENVDWSSGIKLGDMPVNALICTPGEGAVLTTSRVQLRGYAFAGGGRLIERLDLSSDGGRSWINAQLDGSANPWTWRLWQAEIELPPGAHELIARAWDSAANTQPEHVRQTWNFKGYLNNAWHRVHITVRQP